MEKVGRSPTGHLGAMVAYDDLAVAHKRTMQQYWDDVTGRALRPELVAEARVTDLEEYASHGVYVKVPLTLCWERTVRKPIVVQWVDINKGDDKKPKYRSQLVAKEIKIDNRDDLFAATPPVEAKKLFLSWP